MSQNVRVDATKLYEKFKRLDAKASAGVREVIKSTTLAVKEDVVKRLNTPVGTVVGKRGGVRVTQRSKKGQSPRKDTGRMQRSVNVKFSPKGWVGSVTTGPEASDAKGRRYPWMLESGTKKVKKRPTFKKAQSAMKKTYTKNILDAVQRAVRGANNV